MSLHPPHQVVMLQLSTMDEPGGSRLFIVCGKSVEVGCLSLLADVLVCFG